MTVATPSPQRRACCGGDYSNSGDDDNDAPSSPTLSPHATAGIRFRASLPAMLAKILSMVALLTFLSAAVHDSSTSSKSTTRMLKKTATLNHQKPFVPPWFCHDKPCPPFDELASPSPSLYSIRKYRRGGGGSPSPPSPSSFFWARVKNINVSTYEAAYASGSLAIAAYSHGDNAESRGIPSSCFGLPTLVSFFPSDSSFTRAEDRYDVSEFLVPQLAPDGKTVVPFPKPSSSSSAGAFDLDIEEDDDEGTTVYVVQFGGFASGRVSLANAARLALNLERDGLRYRSDVMLLAMYDPPTRLLQRHNEVWLLADADGGDLRKEERKGKEEDATEGEKSEQKQKHKKSKNRKSGGDEGAGSANTAFAA